MADNPNYMQGIVDLGDGLTPIDIWQGLHANARAWSEVSYGPSQNQDRMLIDGTDLSLLKALAEYPAEKWSMLIEATGWTVYGAVGLSWCQGATFQQVWQTWDKSGFVLTPDDCATRPTQLINPGVLPQSTSFSELVTLCGNKALPICILLSSREGLSIDMPAKKLESASAQIAAFLKKKYGVKADLSSEDRALVAKWSAKVQGTEFETAA